MNRIARIVFCAVLLLALFLPSLCLFGVRESFVTISGAEYKAGCPAFTFAGFTNRTYQTRVTEAFSKNFFLRKTFLRTSYQLRDWMNFGLFHYGYNGSILEGRDGVLFERPYAQYHLEGSARADPKKYAAVIAKLKELDAFCRSIGADFLYILNPDKMQTYADYHPRWLTWFWDFRLHDIQSEMAGICRNAGLKVFDANRFFNERRAEGCDWIYPPFGCHVNAYGSAIEMEAALKALAEQGGRRFALNTFLGVDRIDRQWDVDDDIGNLLNVWDSRRMRKNVRYAPKFATTNVLNAGSVAAFGDCNRDQVLHILKDARVFDPKKFYSFSRKNERPQHLKPFIGDLRLLMMVYQSFNTGRLDGQLEQISMTLDTLKAARAEFEERKASPPAAASVRPGFKR